MEIVLTPKNRERLEELALRAGVPKDELAQEAIGSYLEYEEWLRDIRAKIDEGFAQAERGELIDDEDLWRDLERSKSEFLKARQT